MSNKSSSMKSKKGKEMTRAEILQQLDNLATLTTATEATLTEWEVWYRLILMQLISYEKGQVELKDLMFFIKDGPPFTDLPGRIMESIRANIPDFAKEKVEKDAEDAKPKILDATGKQTTSKAPPKILDASGK